MSSTRRTLRLNWTHPVRARCVQQGSCLQASQKTRFYACRASKQWIAPFCSARNRIWRVTLSLVCIRRPLFECGELGPTQLVLSEKKKTKRNKKKPYAATVVQAQAERGWELHVNSVIRAGYYAVTSRFRTAREARTEIDYFRAIDPTINLPSIEETSPETETHAKQQTPASSHQ